MELLKDIKDIVFTNNISEPIVMRSSAGWYIGTIYNDDGLIMPNERLTSYMSKDNAIALEEVIVINDDGQVYNPTNIRGE